MRRLRSFLFATALAGLCPTFLGCSAADEGEDEASAIESKEFTFNVSSALEREGKVDPMNAYWAARLSILSYAHDEEGPLKRALEEIGVPVRELIAFRAEKSLNPARSRTFTGTDGFYVLTDRAGFLVFRGTEDGQLDDMIADISVLQIPARLTLNRASKGRVHAGFHNALHAVWGKIVDELRKRHRSGTIPLYVTGHSLGGALGTLAMHQLLFDDCLNGTMSRIDVLGVCERNYIPVRALYTFGSPRASNEEFSSILTQRVKETKTSVFRFVNEGDQVSMLPRYNPIRVVQPYRHLGAEGNEHTFAVYLNLSGEIVRPRGCEENPQLVQCDLSIWEGVDGVMNGRPPWKVEHSSEIYLEKIRAFATNRKAELQAIRDKINPSGAGPEN